MIVIVGDIGWDFVVCADGFPERGKTLVGPIEYDGPGGGSANTAATIAAADVPVGLITSVGEDCLGEALRQACGLYPMLNPVFIPFDGRTQFTTILVDSSGERTIVVGRDKSRHTPDPGSLGMMQSATVVWVNEEDSDARALYASHAGGLRGLPLGHLAQESETESKWDLLVGSGQDHDRPTDDELHAVGARTCVRTQGAAGGEYWTPADGWRNYPPMQAETVADPVGAGDAFLAGFLVALHRDDPLPKALEVGAAFGSKSVGGRGGWPHMRAVAVTQLGDRPKSE